MILITGSTGYIGQHLARRLIAQGEHPRCLVRDPHKAAQLFSEEEAELVQGDTTQPATLLEAVKEVDTIVHTAFMTADRKEGPGNHYQETNVQGTAHLLEIAEAAGVKRVIEISGLGTRPDKTGSYMQGRYLAEKMLKESHLDWTIIQPSVLFGKGAPFIRGLTDLIRTSPVIPLIGGGKIMFQPIYVEDVVSVILHILANPAQSSHQTYTIGGPEYYSFAQIIDALLHTMHKTRLKVPAPLPLIGTGASAMEAVLPKPPLTRAAMTLFSFDNTTDLKSVENTFGFTPVSFTTYLKEQGL
ncbi:MAG TPA: NAD(P)H-binding protein [Ktedonobacteraceae bacterium]